MIGIFAYFLILLVVIGIFAYFLILLVVRVVCVSFGVFSSSPICSNHLKAGCMLNCLMSKLCDVKLPIGVGI